MIKRNIKPQEELNLNPEISHGLLALFLFVLSILSVLSFFNLAGILGNFLNSLLSISFGYIKYLFPLVLIFVGILLAKNFEERIRLPKILGVLLFFLAINSFVHLQIPTNEMFVYAMQGYGGGLYGFWLAWLLNTYIGYWGGITILLGIFIVSLIFILETTLANLLTLGQKIISYPVVLLKKVFSDKPTQQQIKFKIKGEHLNYTENTEEETKEKIEDQKDKEKRFFAKKQIYKTEEKRDSEEPNSEENNINKNNNSEIIISKPNINYRLPKIDLLYQNKSKPTSGDIKNNAEIIKDTFFNFGIEVEMGEVRVGPTVTQYSLKPAKGIKLSRITTLSNDLALALAAHPIRIEAPIPGKALVGIEVPNQRVATVSLRENLESFEFKNRKHNMMFALGKDVGGKVWLADLPKMPHLLIAGTTGSGKTVCVNSLILSLLFQNTPETLRFIMIDPKRVELTMYNGIPHLLTPVITDPTKTVAALKWTIGEMERRFDVLATAGNRDITSYNKSHIEKMPYIVFIIDELADLMALAASEVEAGIIRIAQMARAVGIHLVVATQRPSVDVITGLMKANIPARIAFSVASSIDSRTILDCPGAEKLLGRGDMLFLTAELSKPLRIQGAFVSEEEIKRVVDYIKADTVPEYNEEIIAKANIDNNNNVLFNNNRDDRDELFNEARAIVIESGKASASLLQRRLKVGYARAARLLDELEEAGIVGPADGAKPREVFTEHLMSEEEKDIPLEKQRMGTGGTYFMPPKPFNEIKKINIETKEDIESSKLSNDFEEIDENYKQDQNIIELNNNSDDTSSTEDNLTKNENFTDDNDNNEEISDDNKNDNFNIVDDNLEKKHKKIKKTEEEYSSIF
ncbi:MAG: DNA translocase FtsK 4TM domain-containing protein [Candidatus Pacearchaeota archaeon]